jgi:hypothetical protein
VRALAIDALLVVAAACAPVAIEQWRGLAHAGGDWSFMFIPHFAWWWSRARWLGGWNPWIFGGFPSNADPLVGHVHPLGLLWAVFPPFTASALEGAAAPALAGVGMLAYLRRVGCTRVGSLIGAMAFACGGYVHAHAGHPEKLRSVLAIPWALLAIEHATGRRLVGGLGLAVAVLVAGGHPQTIAYALLLVGAYGMVFAAGRRAAVLAAIVLGIAVPAVTWLPAVELIGRSHHVHTVSTGLDVMTFACAPTLVVPFACGGASGGIYGASREAFPQCGIIDCTGYPGMVVWLLLLAGLPRLVGDARGRFWLVAGLLGLALSTSIGQSLQLPGVRAPSRALLWWNLAAAAAAALALRPSVSGGRARWWGATLVLVAVVGWASLGGAVARRASAGSLGVLALSAVAGAVPGGWPLVVALGADLAVFGSAYHVGVPPPGPAALVQLRGARDALATMVDAPDAFGRAVAVPAMPDAMWAQLDGVRILQGWNVLVPASFVRLLAGDVAEPLGYDFGVVQDGLLASPASHVLDLLRARVLVITDGAARDPAWATALATPRWRAAGTAARWRIFENTRARPVAWLVDRVRVVDDGEALRLVRGDGGEFDPAREALASEPLTADVGAAGTVRVVTFDDDAVGLRAEVSAAAVLVTSELAAPGWTVEVDGALRPVRVVNAGFRAVELSAGAHDVVFRYRPALGRIGLGIGAVALVVLLGCALPARSPTHDVAG